MMIGHIISYLTHDEAIEQKRESTHPVFISLIRVLLKAEEMG
jgi:hypothetical protein